MSLFYFDHTQDSADPGLNPLVILHGMFGSGDNWLSIARELGRARPVWTIDLPGHGKSYSPGAPVADPQMFDYRNMADTVAETLRAIVSEQTGHYSSKFILLGHSMGGKIAMAIALQAPELVKAVIIVDSAPRDYRNRDYNSTVLQMLEQIDPAQFESRMDADQIMGRWIDDKLVRGFLIKNLQAQETGGFRWRFDVEAIVQGWLQIADWPIKRSDFPIFDGPVLFLAGQNSDYIRPDQDGPTIRDLFPNADIQIVPDARHWIHVDNKLAFMKQVSQFLLSID